MDSRGLLEYKICLLGPSITLIEASIPSCAIKFVACGSQSVILHPTNEMAAELSAASIE